MKLSSFTTQMENLYLFQFKYYLVEVVGMSNSSLWSLGLSAVIIGWLVYVIRKSGRDSSLFRKKGIKAEARIVSKITIGASGTGNTKFKITVEFDTAYGAKTASVKRFFTPEEVVKIMRNNTVSLYYLPENPQKVFLTPDEME